MTGTAEDRLEEAHEGCLLAAVQIFGDKYTPLLIESLSAGSLRFCQIQTALSNLNPRTLSARLTKLEEAGILTKTVVQLMPPHTEYTLTRKGRDFIPILVSLKEWSARYPAAKQQS